MSALPQHVAIIPDGGRRWAKRNDVDLVSGYLKGMEAVEAVVASAASKNISFVSFWILAHQNEKRHQSGVRLFWGY